jgi:hypothetical protein
MNSINARLEMLLAQREKERNAVPSVRPIRSSFNRFCMHHASSTKTRAKLNGFPHNLTAADIEKMFKDQQWCCAVSGIPFNEPRRKKDPFAPSLDRIIPSLGYVIPNVQIVCTIVNFAMNVWGEEALKHLVLFWKRKENISAIICKNDTITPFSDTSITN